MKIKNYKCKCGHTDFFFDEKGNQKGIYCSYCGKWLKWADKDEQNLRKKGRTIDADELLKRISEKSKIPSLSENTINGLCGATAIIYDMLIESGQAK